MLTHELITNSIEHSDGQNLWITVLALPEAVRVEVTDEGGATEPSIAVPGPWATSGRGLQWVRHLSDHWGIEHRDLTSVWFQLDIDAGRSKQVPALR